MSGATSGPLSAVTGAVSGQSSSKTSKKIVVPYSPKSTVTGQWGGKGYYAYSVKKDKPAVVPPPKEAKEIPASYTASDVKFNLPPHKWSLPVNPNKLSSNINQPRVTQHSIRRARMWCFGPTDLAAMESTVKSATSSGSAMEQRWLIEQVGKSQSTKLASFDTAWGFQFLWNPEKLNNALSRNSNFTPSAADKTAQFYSLFTAMEAMTFTITIDRVNDFAAIKGLTQNLGSNNNLNATWQSIVNQYYAGNGYPSTPKNPENPVDQLKTLMKLGTMADIEYIYKMINGEGMNGEVRKNALGRKTADIGFLSPTAIAVQFGPNVDSLSYVGWIDGLSITHTMFTEDMIPIHSEVSVNFVAFARTTLGQG